MTTLELHRLSAKRNQRLYEITRIEREWLWHKLSLEDMELFEKFAEANSKQLYELQKKDDEEYEKKTL
jgi:hypothetical protein